METLKRFKIRGITKDFNQCECCGKENLNYTIAIEDLDFGHVLHFGSTCAANTDKYDTLEAARLAKKEIQKEVRKYSDIVKSAQRRAVFSNELKAFRKANGMTLENCGSNAEYVARFQELTEEFIAESLKAEELRQQRANRTQEEIEAEEAENAHLWEKFKNNLK